MSSPAYSPYTRCQNARCFAPIYDDDAHYFCAEPYCEGCYEDMLPGICKSFIWEMVDTLPDIDWSKLHEPAREAQAA